VCERETERELTECERKKERQDDRTSAKEGHTHTVKGCACYQKHTGRKTDDRPVTAERESEGMHWRESKREIDRERDR